MKMLVVGGLLAMGVGCLVWGDSGKADGWQTTNQPAVSIHDPSITAVEKKGKQEFYLFGSHLAQAKTNDFKTWQVPANSGYESLKKHAVLGDVTQNLAESFEWAGLDDADSKDGVAVWAPDVVWNPKYKWSDGASGAYMYYYSTSSTWRRSCIGFAVSKTIEGPYAYRETILYSGFTKVSATDGSSRDVQYAGTNLPELIADDKVAGFSDNWVSTDGKQYNTDYAPNAIDPNLVKDKKGKIWLSYGSWSGGIYLLALDQETGLPIYPKTDQITSQGQRVDRYFGLKLYGGYHRSGEGPYMLYAPESDYYYLFVTYGGLTADGGYNIRLFRSRAITGPYVDAKGQVPVFNGPVANDGYGIKVMGNYQVPDHDYAYKSPGHNSTMLWQNKQLLLAYHTRFSTKGEYHEVRVHPMMMTANQWPVALPYAVTVTDPYPVVSAQMSAGTYTFMNHGTTTSGTVLVNQTIELKTDGTIAGDVTGTWQQGSGHNLTLNIQGKVYTGVLTQQTNEQKVGRKVVVFSALNQENNVIWGIKH